MSTPRDRDARIGACQSASMEKRADGSFVLRSQVPLGAFPATSIECLDHWAQVAPERTFAAKQRNGVDWERINQRAVLKNRAALVDGLYVGPAADARILLPQRARPS